MAQIHRLFLPVLMTCTMRAACTARVRMKISDTNTLRRPQAPGERHQSDIVRQRAPLQDARRVARSARGQADLPLDVVTPGPTDVRQRIPEHVLRAWVHR